MKINIRPILVGTAVIFGLQLVLAVLIRVYAASVAQGQADLLTAGASFNMMFLGVSLGTFFVGGLFLGFLEERLALGEPVLAAVIAMALSAGVSTVPQFSLPDNTFLVAYAQNGAWGSFFMTVAIGVLAMLGGALIGERIKIPSAEDTLARSIVVIALALVLAGPFYFLIPYGLPWYIAIMATLVIMVLVGVGYYRFVQGSTFETSIEEISISPERHRES